MSARRGSVLARFVPVGKRSVPPRSRAAGEWLVVLQMFCANAVLTRLLLCRLSCKSTRNLCHRLPLTPS